MNFEASDRSRDFLERVRRFMAEHIEPVEAQYWREVHEQNATGDWTTWRIHPALEALKVKARAAGLWNMFLPDAERGAGLSTLEYAPIAEATGRSLLAPEVFNCSAPDSGNIEVLYRYGSDAQKKRWLEPLLAGEIRSVFCMTEPDVASSDATNMQATAVVRGDEVVLNGSKWWTSGLGDPRARVAIFMARTPDEHGGRHSQHSMVLVPLDTPGVQIQRMVKVFGDYDAPHGHGEVHFKDVRLPADSFIAGPGRGFEIAQGRLGPGRIHHCMRLIGQAERALEKMCKRATQRVAFGRTVAEQGVTRERIAEARIMIDSTRFMVLHAAWKMDVAGNKVAKKEIAMIKVLAPTMACQVIDWAMQVHGGGGVSDDYGLANAYAHARTLRFADGPDEVHRNAIAKQEIADQTTIAEALATKK